MPFISILGNLLGGATEEAAKVHAERFQQEQADRNYSSNILLHIIDDPSIGNPAVKEEALQELHGRTLDHAMENYTHKPGKLGKLVDQFVGMTRPQGPMGPLSMGGAVPATSEQTGAGRGNATSSVGGASTVPTPPGQQAVQDASAPAAQGPLPPNPQAMASAAPTASAGPQIPSWLQDSPEDVTPSGFRTAKGQEKLAWRNKWMDEQIAGEGAKARNQVTLGFDVGDFKKGEVIDARMLPMIDTIIKSKHPEAETSTITTPEGHKVLKATDKNPLSPTFMKELGSVDLGETAEIARSGPTELVRAFQRDNGRPPNQKEAEVLIKRAAELEAGARQPFQISVGTALANAREAAQKDLYGSTDPDTVNAYVDDIFGGRQTMQQIPAAGGLRSAAQRAFSERIANGEKPPIPLTSAGSEAVASTVPILQMVQRLRNGILPYANSNTPLGTAGDTLLYNMGIATDSSGNIANAELLRILGGARVIKGASRSVVALEKAMTHLPNIKIDSGKLMYEKLDNLESNLKDVLSAAYTYEGKYGASQNPVNANAPKVGDIISVKGTKIKVTNVHPDGTFDGDPQ